MMASVLALGPGVQAIAAKLPTTSPATARSVQATQNRWHAVETEFGLLTSSQVAVREGFAAGNRQLAHDQRQAGRLLGVHRGARLLYPGFQFDANGSLRPIIKRIAEIGRQSDWADADILLWFTSPTTYLPDDARPVDLLDDAPEHVAKVAEATFEAPW